MLHLYDVFSKDEPDIQEGLEYPWGYWNEMGMFPRVAHEDSAVFSWFQDAHGFSGDFSHFVSEFVYVVDKGEVAVYSLVGVWDDAGIGRMGGYEVYRGVFYFVEVPGVADVGLYLRLFVFFVGGFVREVEAVPGDHYGVRVYVYAYGVPAKELAFYELYR